MEWVKLSAVPAYYVDGALLRAGEAAEVLFCRALAHCGGVESGGRVDKTVLPLLVPRSQARADALIREGLWVDEGSHYRIRSWDKWQDQHDIAADKRRKDRERKRLQRKRAAGGQSADSIAGLSRDSHSDSPSDKRDGHSVEGEGEGETETTPLSRKRSTATDADGFAEFWLAYPRKTAKPNAVKAYRRAIKDTPASVILKAATDYARERQGHDPGFTAHPATWLNARRWEDEPAPVQRPMWDNFAPQDPSLMPRRHTP